ncbi:MAG: helix-turn-helix transcriptional regulator [Bacteroidota bacterium]
MPTSSAPTRLARVVWLDGTDPGALGRTRRRDVVVAPKADWLRAAFGRTVRDRPTRRIARVLVTAALRPRERAAYETVSDVVVDKGVARMLPARELREALEAENRADLLVAASYTPDAAVVTLYRGTLAPLVVPADWFASAGEASGATPDLSALAPTDYGQTLRLGDVEVSADAVLYEFDADYRREAKARLRQDDGIGASIRRLRKQRGLNQGTVAEAAGLSRRELGRIERGEVQSPHADTIERIARALAIAPNELESF